MSLQRKSSFLLVAMLVAASSISMPWSPADADPKDTYKTKRTTSNSKRPVKKATRQNRGKPSLPVGNPIGEPIKVEEEPAPITPEEMEISTVSKEELNLRLKNIGIYLRWQSHRISQLEEALFLERRTARGRRYRIDRLKDTRSLVRHVRSDVRQLNEDVEALQSDMSYLKPVIAKEREERKQTVRRRHQQRNIRRRNKKIQENVRKKTVEVGRQAGEAARGTADAVKGTAREAVKQGNRAARNTSRAARKGADNVRKGVESMIPGR